MRIIDAHLHFSNIQSFKEAAKSSSFVDYSSKGLKKEFKENDIVLGIGMGLSETRHNEFPDINSENPMGLDLEEVIPEELVYTLGINPLKFNGKSSGKEIYEIEKKVQESKVVGLKIYPGYYSFYVWDNIYKPVYELAKEYNLPVVIHGGDPYSDKALIKYSHPIHVDRAAVENRDVNFVIAHFGNPWIMDAAEVIYKNRNVFSDLSGLIVGDKKMVNYFKENHTFNDHINRGIVFTQVLPKWYEKFLFGTDWPLVPIRSYVELIKKIVPEKYYENIFYENALRVFPKINKFIT